MAEEEKNEQAQEGAEAAAEETKDEAPAEETKEEAPAEEKTEEVPKADDSADEGADVEVPEKFKNLVEEIENMSVLDLNELVKLLEKKFGVSAQAVAVAGGGGGAAEEEEGSSMATVELTSIGDQKIGVIKVVKEILGLGLKEAKEMVEGAPAEVKKDIPKEEAEEIKGKLEEAGAQVTLK